MRNVKKLNSARVEKAQSAKLELKGPKGHKGPKGRKKLTEGKTEKTFLK
jgi:hypothetical protein